MQGLLFTQYELDPTVKNVISVTNDDRYEITNWTFNTEHRVLNVIGKHSILYLIIEK